MEGERDTVGDTVPSSLSHPLDGAGPALPLEFEGHEALVDRVVDRASTPGPLTRLIRRPGVAVPALVGLGILLGWGGSHWLARPPDPVATPLPSAQGTAARPVEPRAEPLRSAIGAGEEAPRPDPAPPPGIGRDPETAVDATEDAPSPAGEGDVEGRSPEDLLAIANRHRAGRRWRTAEATYARVVRRHASSSQAYPAALAAADIRLRQLGDPRGALRLYERALALRADGPLTPQALLGLARAAEATGDAARARRALERVLSRYPESLQAPEARRRLDALPQ